LRQDVCDETSVDAREFAQPFEALRRPPAVPLPLAATAWADGPDAVGAAVARAIAGLGAAAPGLVLHFPDQRIAPADVLEQTAAVAASCPVAGMTSDGLITPAGPRFGGCLAIAFGPEVVAGVGLVEEASLDSHAAGARAATLALAELPPSEGDDDGTVLMLFVDPLSGDEADAIGGAYSVVGARIPLAGGGANGANGRVYAGAGAAADAVVAIALRQPAPIGVGIADGCRPRGVPAIATRAAGRVVHELNGRPAEEVYLEGLGVAGADLDDDAFERLAVLHPLAQPELRGRLRLRHVHGRAPDGGLSCATPIPPNAALLFTEQTPQTIVDSAADAVAEAVAVLDGPPRAALVFDCAARKRALGGNLTEEVDALQAALGPGPTVGGLYTRGEVGRCRGAKGDRNHAVVVVALG
jgi:hypothetical protein